MRFVVVTPARDEEKHLPLMVDAMARQTIKPVRWIIVNDGSSDLTGRIAEYAAAQYKWTSVLHLPDRGCRKNGAGVVEAFYAAYKYFQLDDFSWNYIVKLDSDLTFAPDYFERCFEEFANDGSLGIGGGAIHHLSEVGYRCEPHPAFHVRGATKIYRVACWQQIGGLWSGTGWDTIDELKANMLGWQTRTFHDIHAMHHRMTGAAEGGWRDSVKNGRGSYAAGYHPLYVVLRAIRRARLKPYFVGTLAMLWGFASAYFRRLPRVSDARFIKYVRQQQLNRLVGLPTIWI